MSNRESVLLQAPRSLLFFNGQCVWHIREGEKSSYKFLSTAQVAAAFRKEPVDTGWLEPGVVRCGATARGDFAVMSIPAQSHKILDERGDKIVEMPVHLPHLVFCGMGKQYRVYALKQGTLRSSLALFKAPLPNVFDNGGICWGQNNPPKAGAATIRQAWELFITSPFNQHAANGKSQTYSNDVRGLLRALAKSRRKFPLTELVAHQGNLSTLDSAVNSLIGGDYDY